MRLTRWSTRLGACVVAVAVAAADATAQSRLTFEDLCYSSVPRCGTEAPGVLFDGGPILSEYAGFSWWNFRPLDLDNFPMHRPDPDAGTTGTAGYPDAPPTYGSVLGLGFGDVYVHRPVPGGFGLFQFTDLLMGAGWTTGTTVDVVGWNRGATVLSMPGVVLSATSTTFLDLPNVWVDALAFVVNFTPPGYTDPYDSAAQNGGTPYGTFWFDNVGYAVAPSAVPEPATLALVGGGLLLVGVSTRRRRR